MHPTLDGRGHRKDRGRVGDQGGRDRENGNVTDGGKQGQTRRTWGLQLCVDGGVVIRERGRVV